MEVHPRTEEFLFLYTGCEERLFGYLVTLLGSREDAEEVFQETTLVLWRSFQEFEPGTNFLFWAKKIAFHRVLTFRKQRRRAGVPQSEGFLESVERTLAAEEAVMDTRLRALAQCLEKLPAADRQLVACRYESNRHVKDLAAQLGRPANTLYKSLERIRHALIECVNRAVARESRA
jgi:RNA polymerase sigma-70 factor, ECF subfamily